MSEKVGNWFKRNYRNVIIGALVVVPFLVSIISTIHVIDFFQLSNYYWLAITLAIAFEVGALSSLAALAVMDKISKVSLWMIFILITIMQMMGNIYYAFDFITIKMKTNPEWTQNWIDLFSIQGEDLSLTKRILAIVSGGFLPIISLTFLHLLITYIAKSKPASNEEEYEYITVDENGHEIIEVEETPEERVSIPFVKAQEDTKPVESVITTNNESDEYGSINEAPKDTKKDDFGSEIKSNSSEKKTRIVTNGDVNEPIPMGTNSSRVKQEFEKLPLKDTIDMVDNTKINNKSEKAKDVKLSNDILPVISELIKQIKPDANDQDVMELKEQLEKIATTESNGKLKIDLSSFFNFKQSTNPPDDLQPIVAKPEISLLQNKKKDDTESKTQIRAVDRKQIKPVIELPKKELSNESPVKENNQENTKSTVGVGQKFKFPVRANDSISTINQDLSNTIHVSSTKQSANKPISVNSMPQINKAMNAEEIMNDDVIQSVSDDNDDIDNGITIQKDTTFEPSLEIIETENKVEETPSNLELLNGIEPKKKKILLYKEKQKRIYDGYE